ncbi:alpha-galactosidase [Aureococcus anophagefferens]|nr:alpha-galactosidase [Aureococcus anophagefferens]
MVFPKPGLLLLVVPLAQALDNGVGLTPPMGFNDYQTGLGVADLEAVADAFESLGLRAAGYAFINSDAGWQSGRNATSGAPTPNMASLAAALNTRGFGLGLYSALSSVQCGGDPGGLYHEAVDAAAYAAWNVSYVKYDNCAEYALEPTARVLPMRRALNATGRRFVFSTEPFDLAPNLRAHLANLWRTTTDVAADAGKVYVNIDLNDKWAEFAGPGGFNDPDMLQVGKLGGNGGDDDVSNFLLWAVAKAPLLLSVNVSTLSPRLLALAKNPKILAVNQDALGVQGRKVAVDGAATLLDVGVEPCAAPDAFGDDPASVAEVAASKQTFDVVPSGGASLLRSGFYGGRCLALAAPVPVAYAPPRTTKPAWSAPLRAALAPCDADDAAQRWTFSTPAAVAYGGDAPAASLFSLATNGSLLTLLPETDAARAVNHVGGGPPAYGAAGAAEPCESPASAADLWAYDPDTRQVVSGNFTASINAEWLTAKVPGPGRRCLAAIHSADMAGAATGDTEAWAGPLAGGAFAVVLHNRRGPDNATAALPLALLNETRRFWSYASLPSFRRLGYASRVPPMPAAAAAYVASDLETGEVLGPLRLAESLAAPVAKGGARVFRLAPQ